MRIYELTVVLNPNLDKEQVTAELDKLTGMIESADGKVLEVQHFGLRRISFEMKGNYQGNYYTIYFNSSPALLTEMDKSMKLNEAILRTLTIVLKPSEYEPAGEAREKAKAKQVEVREDNSKDDDYEIDEELEDES